MQQLSVYGLLDYGVCVVDNFLRLCYEKNSDIQYGESSFRDIEVTFFYYLTS